MDTLPLSTPTLEPDPVSIPPSKNLSPKKPNLPLLILVGLIILAFFAAFSVVAYRQFNPAPESTSLPSPSPTPTVFIPSSPPSTSGCYYQQVQCFKAPCDAILVCPDGSSSSPDSQTEIDPQIQCQSRGGQWLSQYSECEGVTQDQCQELGGDFNGCESACRHDPSAELCIQVCIAICKL